MNIKQAKTQVKYAIESYLTKDDDGEYRIQTERQRPIFLMGPPGIGKTAIIEQIAQELGISAVSYSMTHHTRQSAVGLPYIKEEQFDGVPQRVTEYTMSEILASVYETIEKTGIREGILFLDEINCVSETLAPSILQFLQYKIFGRHRLPDGWILVTAGNPPEYNRSVREFDIATWDRLKRIDVEPDLDTWLGYAAGARVHPAITSYLKIRRNDFYIVKNTLEGTEFVTARSWTDLSDMLTLYEEKGFPVDDDLLSQYIQTDEAARNFASYYMLFRKYREEYPVRAILSGDVDSKTKKHVNAAKMDERISILGLLLEPVNQACFEIEASDRMMRLLQRELKAARDAEGDAPWKDRIEGIIDSVKDDVARTKDASSISEADLRACRRAIEVLRGMQQELGFTPNDQDYETIQHLFMKENKALGDRIAETRSQMSAIFAFFEGVEHSENEMLLLVTELTANPYTSAFISRYDCEDYFRHSDALKFNDREIRLNDEIGKLDLDEA
ncbi:MAG: ATP-binding protein [Anaerovoracaceae bacterium]|jgi:MoxR-like ATPase